MGCGKQAPNGFAAYIVNQDAHAQEKPGKSYDAEPCRLILSKQSVQLVCGVEGKEGWLVLDVPLQKEGSLESILGTTLEGATGQLRAADKSDALDKGSFTLQTLKNGVARGNFSARMVAGSALEVVGSFEARVQ
jgi:hypothetical protein